MPGMITTEWSEAVAAAINAEKERKRKEINEKIQALEQERAGVTEQIEKLEAERLKMHSYQKMWEEKKHKYDGNDILSEVVIVNIFEGVCADKLKNDLSSCIQEMDRTYSKAGGFKENIGAQIKRLNRYISDINADISGLKLKLLFI